VKLGGRRLHKESRRQRPEKREGETEWRGGGGEREQAPWRRRSLPPLSVAALPCTGGERCSNGRGTVLRKEKKSAK